MTFLFSLLKFSSKLFPEYFWKFGFFNFKMHINFTYTLTWTLLSKIQSELPPNTLRLVEGPFDPEQIFQLVKIGVDEFDNSYVTYLAERGRAFRLTKTYPEIDKRKKSESGEVLQCATESTKTSFFQIVDFNDPR